MNPDDQWDIVDLLLKGIEAELRFRQRSLGADPDSWEYGICTRTLHRALQAAWTTPRTETVICTDQEVTHADD